MTLRPTSECLFLRLTRSSSLALLLTAALATRGQDNSPAPASASAAAPAADAVVRLDSFQVTDVPLERQILPTARPFSSVFGTDDSIVDVPRNVTIISRQQLSDISILSVLDFTKLTSSAYTTTNFGAPSNPSIRGQTADLFINGVRGRITSNGNGLPLNFNSVESVNIVKGPATAVQGTSMYVGGFVDLVTKRPHFDGFKGTVAVTLGSYAQKEWTLDVGGPFSPRAAYRVSWSGQDSRGYWHDYFQKNHSLYAALTLRPSPGYELFLNASAALYHYTENWGLNRVTQDLIDHGRYLTGVNDNPAPNFAAYPFGYADAGGAPISFANLATVGGVPAPVSDPQNARWITSGFPAGNRLAFGPAVTANRHIRLLRPGDRSRGREFNFQAIQTRTFSSGVKLVNNSYWSHTARDTYSSYYYSEIIDPSWFAENRTEFITATDAWSLNAGLDLRYQRTKAYDDYFFEPVNVWDLTRDRAAIDATRSVNFPNPFTSLPVPGWPGRYATDGIANSDTNDSRGASVALFAQTSRRLTERLRLVAGARAERFRAHVREPLLASHPAAALTVWIPNVNASLVLKPTPASSLYATVNWSRNTSGASANGGGLTGWNADGSALFRDNFLQPSRLLEGGAKFVLRQNRLFVNCAVFDQTRTARSPGSSVLQEFHARGFEAELNYQPDPRFYATASYSYIDATTTAGFQSDGGVARFAATRTEPGRVSGLPRHLFNALASYAFAARWTATANVLVTGPMFNNFAATLRLPTQYQLDASLTYRAPRWSARAAVSNLTNEKNWAPPNAVYGNGSILALPGTQAQLTLARNF